MSSDETTDTRFVGIFFSYCRTLLKPQEASVMSFFNCPWDSNIRSYQDLAVIAPAMWWFLNAMEYKPGRTYTNIVAQNCQWWWYYNNQYQTSLYRERRISRRYYGFRIVLLSKAAAAPTSLWCCYSQYIKEHCSCTRSVIQTTHPIIRNALFGTKWKVIKMSLKVPISQGH